MLHGVLRRIAHGARVALLAPPLIGAAYMIALSAWAGLRTPGLDAPIGDVGDMGDVGASLGVVEALAANRFPEEVTRMRIGVAAMALALGLAIGLVAELLLRLRHPSPTLARRSWTSVLLESSLLVVALHAALEGWAMADTPQLYAAGWYDHGGLRRTAQVLATDALGPRGVVLVALVLAVLYVRPARRAYLALALAPLVVGAAFAGRPHPPTLVRDRGRSAVIEKSINEQNPIELSDKAPGRLNVLILAASSLRADRVDPRVAPNLSELAARSTRFERAYVSLPRTSPSWVTILTGRHAHHHGVRSVFPTRESENRAKNFDALPERFAKAGYTTGVVSDDAGAIFGRLDLGFDLGFDLDLGFGFERARAPAFDLRQTARQSVIVRETPLLPVLHSQFGRRLFPAMRGLRAATDPRLLAGDVETALRSMKGAPFFVTVFFSATHTPYAAPAPYYAKFTDRSYRGRFKYGGPLVAPRHPLDPVDVRQIQGLYDGAVAAVDDAMGRVLKTLERLGLADSTIVVVTADHGETLFDAGRGQGHGDHLFGDEGTHVPLVIYDPRIDGGRGDSSIVRDVDLAPTLYELAGVEAPTDLDGRSLVPALRGEPLAQRFAYAETGTWFAEDVPDLPRELRLPYPGGMELTELEARDGGRLVLRQEMLAVTLMARHRMVRDERWKLVYAPTRTGVRYILFDTEADPDEREDVAAAYPNEVARLRAELWAWMLRDPSMEQRDGYLVPVQRSEAPR